ncbi:MAG: proline--tRNA ligase [Limnochordia bacterium]|jgi:prolyl-tRNA synthetase
MRMTAALMPTLRETPAEAEIVSHQLMLRAGYMRRTAAGIYTYLPLGYRVLKKIMNIIREEMDAAGGQELLLPILQPAELWHETGRWDDYGEEMFQLRDRHGRSFCLGPTHEELITALVRVDVSSYRQLPLLLYQIQNKYRDEVRPRFGVIRGREFIMKDLYSFDTDEAGLDISYKKMYEAYKKIFGRCGLDTIPVLADSGAIGGSTTHEFVVLAPGGEATVVYCDACGYGANVEQARCVQPPQWEEEPLALEKLSTPGAKTIAEVSAFLDVPAQRLIKTLIYKVEGGDYVAALVRGDHEVNEIKLASLLGVRNLEPADPEAIETVTGGPVGFCGPVGLKIRLIADYSVAAMANGITGGNEEDIHLGNVNMGRDFQAHVIGDIRNAQGGDPCPQCGAALQADTGIEVGQVFKLGTKYSEALKATFKDEKGQEQPILMGCYGIGVTRTMAAIIEQHHDEHGIKWPVSVAPFQVHLIPLGANELTVAEDIYQRLVDKGLEVLLDDRNERPGVKFKDADLIGIPLRVTIGAKGLAQGVVELKHRHSGEEERIPLEEIDTRLAQILQAWE